MALIGAHKIHRHPDDSEKQSQAELKWMKIQRKNRKVEEFRWLYEGQVFHRKSHGFGVLSKVFKTGETEKIYAGEWVDGKKQGFGAFWYSNGDFYEGEFCGGQRHGFGRLWGADGSFYQGQWREERYEGPGMLIQVDGNRYEGNFSKGKKNGLGRFYHLRRGLLQEGFWSSDICKSSIMRDISRDLAPEPTIYPIPELGKYISRVSLAPID
ncbi:MORN repeat-containing protein 3-like [Diachasmimorpha longicaudata]|uniref:MORN repeat-containing protein 3-like n=1 Tax=Diachasmimorpha longicaudata TaxID=58733 RepID=UPI0030B88FB5